MLDFIELAEVCTRNTHCDLESRNLTVCYPPSPSSGPVSHAAFERNYAFLDEMKKEELAEIRKYVPKLHL